MFTNDILTDIKPQTGPFTLRFRGKERRKDLLLKFRRDIDGRAFQPGIFIHDDNISSYCNHVKLRSQNQSWRRYRHHLITENKWRAVRYGVDGKLIDFGKQEEVPLRFLALELLEPPQSGWVKVRHRDNTVGYARIAGLWGL